MDPVPPPRSLPPALGEGAGVQDPPGRAGADLTRAVLLSLADPQPLSCGFVTQWASGHGGQLYMP
jgi:hypothetical protein